MGVVSPGGGGGDDPNHRNGLMDVGVDLEDISSYYRVKDRDCSGGGNDIVPSSSVVERGRLRGRQRGKTLSTTTTYSMSNPNTTFLSAERFYCALDDVMVAAVTSSSSYSQSKGSRDKDNSRIGRRRRGRQGR